MVTKTTKSVGIRPYADADEPRVLELLTDSLGGGPAGDRTPEFFRWKHLENPFGRSFMLLAEADERIVGLRAFLRWRFRGIDGSIGAVRAVDTATHPDYQGLGIFSRLTKQALHDLEGDAALVFNTPNSKSLPGYLKMGWSAVGKVPVRVGVRRPIRFARRVRGWNSFHETDRRRPPVVAESASEALADPGVRSLMEGAEDGSDRRFRTERTVEYLRWRYGSAPLLDYRAVRVPAADGLAGMAFFRVRPRGRLWESTVGDVIVRPGDPRTAHQLLRRVAVAAAVDHLTCSFPAGSAAARGARRAGTFRTPGGMTIVARPVGEAFPEPDPTRLDSWGLSLGDLEVF